MRATTAFSRLLRLGKGVLVKRVDIGRDRVVVGVALRRRRLVCPECGYSTRARKDTRPEDSVGAISISGSGGLRSMSAPAPWCPVHGARTEDVPFARPDRSSRVTSNACWHGWQLARTRPRFADARVDWRTIGRIIKRVCDDELDPGRLNDLFEIGIDEVSWKKQRNYLTLVADHRRRKIVWGCEGKGEKAADSFFEELDPARRVPPAASTGRERAAPGARASDHGAVRAVPDRPPATASQPTGLTPGSSSTQRSSRAPPG